MKFKLKWTACYETIIEAEDLKEARDEAGNIDIDVRGSRYIEDSWEVTSLAPAEAPARDHLPGRASKEA
jgi:hypothetical protein